MPVRCIIPLVLGALLASACGPAASPAPNTSSRSASTTTQASASAVERVVVTSRAVAYELPPECTYTGNGEKRGATSWWPIRCATDLPFALNDSLGAQGWSSCGCVPEGCAYRTNELNVAGALVWLLLVKNEGNRLSPTGELGQRPLAERPGITPTTCAGMPIEK